jgi:hypothetical protein
MEYCLFAEKQGCMHKAVGTLLMNLVATVVAGKPARPLHE